ncbi:MAG TPA: lipoprotein-releasing ABC transporter permease subunit [Thiotrichales bacterium]|nr:lipoprotein-releasing ABC transporter permease subunit [Thiotrichales bacterium]
MSLRPFTAFVGWRYVRDRRGGRFVSFIALASMLGIALGVWVLVTVLSVMNGYQRDVQSRILGMVAHAVVDGAGDGMPEWRQVLEAARADPRVAGAAPYLQGQGMISHRRESMGVVVRGIVPEEEKQVTSVSRHMEEGGLEELLAGERSVILGRELARRLQVERGDRVTLVVPRSGSDLEGPPRMRVFRVAGIYSMGLYEFDSRIVFTHMQTLQELFGAPGWVTGIRLRLHDPFQAPTVARNLVYSLGGLYLVSDWTRQYSNLFRAIAMQKQMLFLLLLLIISVAAFNIVATLVMVVTEKQADIAILRTLGASSGEVMAIFIVQGALIGAAGIVLGAVMGVLTAWNVEEIVATLEGWFHVRFLPPDVYNIMRLSAELQGADLAWITGMAVFLTLIATLYPAWRAARVQPAAALRYE